MRQFVPLLSVVLLAVSTARADIYQWEWVDRFDLSQGKYETGVLCPGGAGVVAEPHANLASRNLTKAYLLDKNLRHADLRRAALTDADFSRADLSYADLTYAGVTDANFTDATIRGLALPSAVGKGFTKRQLYATASYQAGDLREVDLSSNDLGAWNFAGQDLSGASFGHSRLGGASFTDAKIRGANLRQTAHAFTKYQLYSTATYKDHALGPVNLNDNDLTGWDFSDQDLAGSSFQWSDLTRADLSGADLTGAQMWEARLDGADFTGTIVNHASLGDLRGFTKEQFYSTASYQSDNLEGVRLYYASMAGWDVSGKKWTDGYFKYASLSGADLSNADFRGSEKLNAEDPADVRNMIHPDGRVDDFVVMPSETVRLWDYDSAEVPVQVHGEMAVAEDGTLRLVFDDAEWGAKIAFEPGAYVSLGGTLLLDFDPEIDVRALRGTTFDLFDWDGASLATEHARFDAVSSLPGMSWDTSLLYATGQVTLLAVPEPATAMLFGLACLAWAAYRRGMGSRRQ